MKLREVIQSAAKKIVLKTHPDKSGLDKAVFMFFVKAYNMLVSVYKFKNLLNL